MTMKVESNGVAGIVWSGSGLLGLKWAEGCQPFCPFRRDFTVWRWESQVAHAFHAAGGNCLDTAHLYGDGDNERVVGQWTNERGLRDEIVILGKGAHNSQDRKRVTPYDILSDLHDSLARFKVDSIDLYLLHKDDPEKPVGPIVETLHAAKEAGQIDAYGGSNWSAERVQEANRYAAANGLTPFVASSPISASPSR